MTRARATTQQPAVPHDAGARLRAARRGRSAGIISSAAMLGCGLVGLVGLVGLAGPAFGDSPGGEIDGVEAPVRHHDEGAVDGYVTSSACRPCHPARYESWAGSYHRRMTQPATTRALAGDVSGLELEVEGQRYRFETFSEDDVWVHIDPPGEAPETSHRLALTTGSHHRQWVWFETGRGKELGTLPFVYLIREKRWVPRPAAFLEPPLARWKADHWEGQWSIACINCHTTYGRARSAGNHDGDVAEYGIACESCHGPGEEHVTQNRDLRRRYGLHLGDEADPTITTPKRLDPKRASEVCGQCHSVGAADYLGVHRDDYRPGDDLAAILAAADRSVPQRLQKKFQSLTHWKDGQIRTGGREYDAISATPCFEAGAMGCSSCHQMHVDSTDERSLAAWADDQLGPGMRGNAGCTQCHKIDLTAHTRHGAESAGSSCYNCHSPYTTYALLKAIRSHAVGAPSVAETVDAGRPNACNLCHLDKTLAWTADKLKQWYDIDSPELGEDERTVAAGALWALEGNAGVRALSAWHMGWGPAREASGIDWTVPYLAVLLNDPYDAVRLIAYRSLRTVPGYEPLRYDYIAPQPERGAVVQRVLGRWTAAQGERAGAARPAVLIDANGALQRRDFLRLGRQRDDTPVQWVE